jgi:Co/Zn/Cd efflux system component
VSRSARLWTVLWLNVLFVGVLAITGIGAHSLGVFAEGLDYLADAAAIGLALFAIWLSNPSSGSRPNRHPKAPAWAALVTGAVLRLFRGSSVASGVPMLVVSGLAAITMLVGAVILSRDTEVDADRGSSLAMRAVLLDTAADAAAAGAVAITGAVIIVTHANWLDPTIALLVSVLVALQAIGLLCRVVADLRQPATLT